MKCKGCGSVIAMGVRLNAERKRVGTYETRKIWRFTLKCPCCGSEIVFENSLRNSGYHIVKGAQKTAAKRGKKQVAGVELDKEKLMSDRRKSVIFSEDDIFFPVLIGSCGKFDRLKW